MFLFLIYCNCFLDSALLLFLFVLCLAILLFLLLYNFPIIIVAYIFGSFTILQSLCINSALNKFTFATSFLFTKIKTSFTRMLSKVGLSLNFYNYDKFMVFEFITFVINSLHYARIILLLLWLK